MVGGGGGVGFAQLFSCQNSATVFSLCCVVVGVVTICASEKLRKAVYDKHI